MNLAQNAFVEANDNVAGMPILERIMNLEQKVSFT
jgi:hypothetical protein